MPSATIKSAFCLSLLLASTTAYADNLESPAEKSLLTISGKIGITNNSGAAQFDRGMLESLGSVSVETATPWHEGVVRFEGVSLSDLMDKVAAAGTNVEAVALNDYSVTIPVSDFAKFGVILAYKMNGEYMTVRDKGPLFIIYPFDSNPDLQTNIYHGRSAWQVSKLIVE